MEIHDRYRNEVEELELQRYIAKLQTSERLLRAALTGILESTCGHTVGGNTCLSDEVWTKAEDALRGI